jgi:hypothetical protein
MRTPRQTPPQSHAPLPRTYEGIVSRMTPVMTIMDLEISSDVARRAQLGDLGVDTSALLNFEHLNTAYAYIAQLLVFLSVVLDVPMMYHVDLQGSFCRVQQMMPASAAQASLRRDAFEVRACP